MCLFYAHYTYKYVCVIWYSLYTYFIQNNIIFLHRSMVELLCDICVLILNGKQSVHVINFPTQTYFQKTNMTRMSYKYYVKMWNATTARLNRYKIMIIAPCYHYLGAIVTLRDFVTVLFTSTVTSQTCSLHTCYWTSLALN